MRLPGGRQAQPGRGPGGTVTARRGEGDPYPFSTRWVHSTDPTELVTPGLDPGASRHPSPRAFGLRLPGEALERNSEGGGTVGR
jgi:hypothetical protein